MWSVAMRRFSLSRLWSAREGAIAVTFAIAAIPLMLGVGLAVDYKRWMTAQQFAQNAADAASLAAAASGASTDEELQAITINYASANLRETYTENAVVSDFQFDEDTDEIRVTVTGSIPTTFLRILGRDELSYSAVATAKRGPSGTLEVVLVLDNTNSMTLLQDPLNASGGSRITALRAAANMLVTELTEDPTAQVRIGLVPYANYVNVGLGNRTASWITVAADYSVPGVTTPATTIPASCTTSTTRQVCTSTPRTCQRQKDGVWESYSCPVSTCTTVPRDPPVTTCTPERIVPASTTATRYFRWYGCVNSRTSGTLRLSDAQPETRYVGRVNESPICLTPIIPLTSDIESIRAGITGMVTSLPGFGTPMTYIPTGMLWGINVLSPTAPFTEGAPYDPDGDNRNPRKAIVLMTDGKNSLYYTGGNHNDAGNVQPTFDTRTAASNTELLTLCTYAKSRNIEVFVVAFGAEAAEVSTMLSSCATDAAHFYLASDGAALEQAFQNIGESLSYVRLTN
jgi:Flp pilus assembly protein TadG